MKTVLEPFRIKSIEPFRVTTPSERVGLLAAAHHNLFRLRAEDVMIDLLTDSGTGAMSAQQWAAIMTGDESYAGSSSFFELEKVVQQLTGYRHVFPVHQGRAAERILFGVTVVPFTTSIMTEYLNHSEQQSAVIIYSGWFFVVAVMFNLLWRHASRGNRLFSPHADLTLAAAINRAYNVGLTMYLVSVLLAFVSPPISLVITTAMGVFFALPNQRMSQLAAVE